MPDKNFENEPFTNDQVKEEGLTSDDVANAHAAGDGATVRSKEAITEEEVHPDKLDKKPAPDRSSY